MLFGKVEWIGFLKIVFIIELLLIWKKFVEKEVFEIIFNELLVKGFIKSSIFVSKD